MDTSRGFRAYLGLNAIRGLLPQSILVEFAVKGGAADLEDFGGAGYVAAAVVEDGGDVASFDFRETEVMGMAGIHRGNVVMVLNIAQFDSAIWRKSGLRHTRVCSSRTLPGQARLDRYRTVSEEKPSPEPDSCPRARWRKCLARGGISERRSRSGGIRISKPHSR
jgi:hypothetical protein